ncbi:DUF885 domain-containing protein [Myxacorys almedinensis]|uniref:DUF885 family protein n=1 Tax=Myxacorys almedinensis A TaxID=2690445 RepID=A0A8J7Z1C7_9CYAN|nr:DUF885 domain-containing protein [Myxacorys almedinensis]NDJ18522.1 DUF885 family protein [Myxacorys almedinensis A]
MFRVPNRLRSAKVHRIGFTALSLLTCVACILIYSVRRPAVATSPWITRSNEYAALLTKAEEGKECRGEFLATKELLNLNPSFVECQQQRIRQTIHTLEEKLSQEKDNALRVDLAILIQAGQRELRSRALEQKHNLPYVNLGREIANSFSKTFRESSSLKTKQLALVELKQYAGKETGKPSLVALTEQQIRDRLKQSDIYFPEKSQLESDLKNITSHLDTLQKIFGQHQSSEYEDAYATLKTQLLEYDTFIRREVLPKARSRFRLPAEIYAFKLEEKGIEIPVEDLIRQAHAAFEQVQQKMDAIAPQVAQQKRLNATDYRAVIQALKQDQLSADEALHYYQQREKEIEAIIRRERLVTLPKRSLKIRLASAKENASFPVPQYRPASSPNSKQGGTFILPVLQPKTESRPYNDFTHPAVAWTLTAHEGRPGHDLQFTTIQDQGLSDARTKFAYNAANHEGWATYAEEVLQPYMPLEGRFISLQFQLLRAARAFLEPELQLGKITTAEAIRVLTQDAGFSRFFAEQEIQRYLTRLPGHAPGYFYGYQRLMELRSQVETALGSRFNAQEFHDFILSQGFLSQRMLQEVVSQKFNVGRRIS